METTLYLLRHGKTPANLENRFAGRTGEALHPEGIEQLQAMGYKLKDFPCAKIITGPLPRTRQSGEILQSILAAPLKTDDRLNEIYIPHWDGLTKDEIRNRFGRQYPDWLETHHYFYVPGFETIDDVQKRAVDAIESLLDSHRGCHLVVVSHLIVLRSLLLYYQDLEISQFRSIKIDNGSLTILHRDPTGKITVEQQIGLEGIVGEA